VIHESGNLSGANRPTLSQKKEWSMVRTVLTVVVLALLVSAAAAQDVKQAEPVVVTATKVETPREQLGASVTVITEQELKTYNYSEFQEAVRQVPGVDIQRFGGLGRNSNIRIRGANPNQVQVLVDGMRVKSPTLGSADLSEMSLDAIDRIEIVRGPQSTLYGADAIGGVVNVITKKGAGPVQSSVHVQAGSYATFREQANVQGSYGGFNFNLSGSRYDTEGYLRRFKNDDAEQAAFSGRVGYDFPWKGELSLTGRYTKLETDLPIATTSPKPTVLDPNFQQQTDTWLYNVAYKQTMFDWWNWRVRFGQWFNNVGNQNPPPPPGDAFGVPVSQTDTKRQEAELINTFDVATWNAVTVGVEHRREQGATREVVGFLFPPQDVSVFHKTLNTYSVFGQDEIRLLDRLFVTGGLRWEDNDTYGESLTPRVSVAVVIKESGTKLRGGWAEGFRAPTINDLLFPGFGNTSLKPEHSESWEVGLDQKVWQNRLRFGTTYFHNTFRDLIQFKPVAGAPFGVLPVNVGRAKTYGWENYVEVEPLDWLLLYANYTITRSRDTDAHTDLTRTPAHHYNAGVAVTPIPRLTLFAQATVVSSALESAGQGLRNQGYHRIDVGGTFRLFGRHGVVDRTELTARIENVTDESYTEIFGVKAAGFNALVGLRAYLK